MYFLQPFAQEGQALAQSNFALLGFALAHGYCLVGFCKLTGSLFKEITRQFKTQWMDQVQGRAGIGTKAYHIAGVRRDFRLVCNQVEHT